MENNGCTLILGMFDGVHIGHRALVEAARSTGRPVVAYTFDCHPMVIVNGFAPPMLMTNTEKRAKLLELGVQSVVMETFDERLSKMPEREYIESLYTMFHPGIIAVGYNHTFGAGGKGRPETIRALANGRYETIVVPPVQANGKPVSSTLIRGIIAEGKLSEAAVLLGEPYCLDGIVEPNSGLGTDIGFPTANIPLPDKLLPPYGVYAVRARFDRERLPGVMNIGVKPTVTSANTITLETHIIGFEGDVYGKRLTLEMLDFIRPERRFESKAKLAAQIAADKAAALKRYKK